MKKIIGIASKIFLSLLLVVSVLGLTRVFADNAVFKITNIGIKEKTDGVIVNDASISHDEINNDIVLTDKDDFITYNITIKNNSDKNYLIKSISDDNDSEYLEYNYSDMKDVKIESGKEKTIELTLKYKKESNRVNISTKKLNIFINYEEIPGGNPSTGDHFYFYLIILIVSLLGLSSTFIFKKKSTKLLMLLGLLLIPISIKADTNTYVLVINNNIKAREYTVTLDTNGGSEIDNILVVKGNKVDKPDDPTRTGYIFNTWYLDDSEFDFNTPITSDITLTAIWDEDPVFNFYTVTFDSNGGSAVASQRVLEGELAVEPEQPTMEYYIFNGWYVVDEHGGMDHLFYFDTPITSNLLLKADWLANPDYPRYDVTFYDENNEFMFMQSVITGDKAIRPADPVKEDFVFSGWYLENGELFDFDTPIVSVTDLYERFEEDPLVERVTVTFDSDGGSEVPSQRIIKNKEHATEPELPTKEGFRFEGWYLNDELFDFNSNISEDITLVAHWIDKGDLTRHEVHFLTYKSSVWVKPQTVIDGEKLIRPEDPIDTTEDHELFRAWLTEDGEEYDFDEPVTESFNLTARWSKMCMGHEIVEGTYSGTPGAIEFKYSDCLFEEEASKYNTHLATASANYAVASATYINGNDYSNGDKTIRGVYEKSGFENIKVSDSYKLKPTTSSVAYIIGSKDVQLQRGTKKLISITIRSANYEKEWASNVKLGLTGQAFGFDTAKDQVWNGVYQYILDQNLTDEMYSGDVIFWVQGFSRGGAITNLLSKQLIDEYSLAGNEVYAYCIEPPRGGLPSLKQPGVDYSGIHNIVNPDDIVPYVAPYKMGFIRYGIDHYIFDNTHDLKIEYEGNAADNYPYPRASDERLKLVDIQLYNMFQGNEKWKDHRPFTITSKHVKVPIFSIEDSSKQEYTSSFLRRFVEGLAVQPDGTPVISRDDYVNDDIQDILSRMMEFFNSDPDLEKLNLQPSDLVDGGGAELIFAIWSTLHRVTLGNEIVIKFNYSATSRYLFAAAIRDIIGGKSDEELSVFDTYPSGEKTGRYQALDDIEDLIYHALRSADYVDDYTTLAYNVTDIITNHSTTQTLAWLRSYDDWYFGSQE